ncbi:MAG: hypothetical protein V3V28_12400 [Polaribacter sp.]|uniref:hypothetical protein n=1 Tax=Polaribacter sp. TaxID=1920175 RepID=UPI002F35E75E
MFKSLKTTCDEATTICDKSQYGAATLSEKIKLSVHFIRCKICSKYTKHNNILTRVYNNHAKSCKASKQCMTIEEKEALKKEFEKIKI